MPLGRDAAGIWGWFPEANVFNLERLLAQYRIRSVIEIGTFLGRSAAWFAHRVDRVICVDLWCEPAERPNNNNLLDTLKNNNLPNPFFHIFEDNMRAEGVWGKITPVVGSSRDVHGLVGDADLLYVDGDHSYAGCSADIRLYGPKARKVICGDDYVERVDFGVREAVDELLPERHIDAPFWWVVK